MPIQLDKILADIAEEKHLHLHNEAASSKKDQDEAWIKVGKKNKLSAHEAKSIFKVLQKKYEQEKMKASSSWKLFHQMEEICKKQEEIIPKIEEEIPEHEEEEAMVEFLEVREEEEDYEDDSDNQDKSMGGVSPTSSPEKESSNNVEIKTEPKVLNTNVGGDLTVTSTGQQQQLHRKQTAFSKALQNKNISLRKTPTTTGPTIKQTLLTKTIKQPGSDSSRSMLLPESVKRKLQNAEYQREDVHPTKKINFGTVQTATSTSQGTVADIEIKKETVEEMDTAAVTSRDGINVITIPSNNQTISGELSNGLTTLKPNGFNPQIEEFDFQKDIIFDSTTTSGSKTCNHNAAAGEIINIGNFDNQLPPTFFKNLCNSNRHEALGLYVANVMNRITGKTAAKLEINILKAIIDAQSDEMTKL